MSFSPNPYTMGVPGYAGNPAAAASAQAIAGTSLPTYAPTYSPVVSYPQYLPQTLPSYSPTTSYASANAFAGSTSTFPSIQTPTYLPSFSGSSFANAYASSGYPTQQPSYLPTFPSYSSAFAQASSGFPSYPMNAYPTPGAYPTMPNYPAPNPAPTNGAGSNQLLIMILMMFMNGNNNQGGNTNNYPPSYDHGHSQRPSEPVQYSNNNGNNPHKPITFNDNNDNHPHKPTIFTDNNNGPKSDVLERNDNDNDHDDHTPAPSPTPTPEQPTPPSSSDDAKADVLEPDKPTGPPKMSSARSWGQVHPGAQPRLGQDGNYHVPAKHPKGRGAIISPTGDVLQRAIDPLTFDLGGNGINTTNQKVSANIDGKQQTVNNIGSDDAVLTLNGKIVGDNADLSNLGITEKPKDAQEALSLIARKAKQDGVIKDSTKLSAADLDTLHEKYGLSVRVGDLNGQDESFTDAGIQGLNVSNDASQKTSNFDGKGNDLTTNGTSFTRSNGSKGQVGDIWYNKR